MSNDNFDDNDNNNNRLTFDDTGTVAAMLGASCIDLCCRAFIIVKQQHKSTTMDNAI
jgi:hypothetical protein